MSSFPYPLGLTLVEGGANVAVYSERADSIDVAVFDAGGVESRHHLSARTGHVFHGFIEGLVAGGRYALRVNGPWDPDNGLRFNDNKLLLDPRATAISGEWDWGQAVFSHRLESPEEMDVSDGSGHTPLCIVTDPTSFDWGDDVPLRHRVSETVIYETHVKGISQLHPDVPQEIRGTYAGLAHPAITSYLSQLGVTAVELMPVHHFAQDSHLQEKGLRNYWGYNSIGFFAPHAEYSAAGADGQQVDEFKSMVKALHAAGIEVILDVVFNHTAEGNELGPSLSLKGIDNESYYRLVEDDRAHYFDTTGTGNSLNVSHPAALGLIMDSLRYWVTEMHVDGFRFDLATTLTRQGGDASIHSAFLDLIAQDPTLAATKMIAEPWDTAGYQVGGFPADWSEWNGKFRDDVREFWAGDSAGIGAFVQRVLGSPDVYEGSRRSPLCSVNFITAHDGFTLADLTSYSEKHNEANGEDNADGESDNHSNNYGVEGPTDDAEVNAVRLRQRKNFLASVVLSAGVPMILGGDEFGRTQQGNNNAYCQDDELSWYDWESADQELSEFVRALVALRQAEPTFRPDWYRQAPDTGADKTVVISGADGSPFNDDQWDDAAIRAFSLVFSQEGADRFTWLVNGSENGVEFSLDDSGEWRTELSSDPRVSAGHTTSSIVLDGRTFALLRSHSDD